MKKEFIESLSEVGEEDYKKIDAVLKKMSEKSIKDLYKIRDEEKRSKTNHLK